MLHHVRDIMGEVMECVILVLDDHGSLVTCFLLKGLMKEFNLFPIPITSWNSTSMMPQMLLNRFMSAESTKIDTQGDKNW